MNSFLQIKNLWRFFLWILIIALLLIQIGFIMNQPWTGDYWEHRAVLQELMDHPIHPQHPQLAANIPHPFFSPYLVAAGFVGAFLNADAAVVLNFLSILNLALFLVCISILRIIFLPMYSLEKGMSILLFIFLFCWGINPPFYSSFIHLGSFPYTLSYPSTFAWIASVLAAYTLQLSYESISRYKYVLYRLAALFFATICLLTHPLTYFFTAALILFVLFDQERPFSTKLFLKHSLNAVFILITPWLLAACWPYFPFYSLLNYSSQIHQVHTDSRELYSNIYLEVFPLFLLLPLLLRKPLLSFQKHRSLLIPLAFLALLFVYGFISHSYIIGRTLAFIVVFSQLLLIRQIDILPNISKQWIWSSLLLFLTIPFIINTLSDIVQAATTTHKTYLQQPLKKNPALNEPVVVAHHLMFLKTVLPKNKVVLADTPYLPFLPGLGSKVPAVMSPVYWISDNQERKASIRAFFHDPNANHTTILQELNADYILIPSSETTFIHQKWKEINKLPVVQKNGFSLYQIRK